MWGILHSAILLWSLNLSHTAQRLRQKRNPWTLESKHIDMISWRIDVDMMNDNTSKTYNTYKIRDAKIHDAWTSWNLTSSSDKHCWHTKFVFVDCVNFLSVCKLMSNTICNAKPQQTTLKSQRQLIFWETWCPHGLACSMHMLKLYIYIYYIYYIYKYIIYVYI